MNDFEKCFCGKCGRKYVRKPGTVLSACPHCGAKIEIPDAADVRKVQREFERPYVVDIPIGRGGK